MSDNPVWEDVQRLADDLRLQIHLGGMDVRDRWHALEPRLVAVEKTIAVSGEHASEAIERELSEIQAALVQLRAELVDKAHGDFATGW